MDNHGKYPFYSPYAFSGNRVIDALELEGLEPESVNAGTDYLFIVVLGFDKNPPKGKTQYKNTPHVEGYDYDNQVNLQGLTEIEKHFENRNNIKVVVFSSSDLASHTVADMMGTMKIYIENNPNGKIAIVAHSLGAINSIDAAVLSKLPIYFMYLIDPLSTGFWDNDNIPSNVKYLINVFQKTSWPLLGESVDILNKKSTTGFNLKTNESNMSHQTIDNIFTGRAINRLERIAHGIEPLTPKEVQTIENTEKSNEGVQKERGKLSTTCPKF